MKITGESLVNDWLEGTGKFENDPLISNSSGSLETNDAPNQKKVFVYYGEKLN